MGRVEESRSDSDNIQKLEEMTNSNIQYWLTRFILEARRKDGCMYASNSYCCLADASPTIEWKA